MADIYELLEKLKTAVYGRDVRQAIHDSIQQCYADGKSGTTDLIARQLLASKANNTELIAERKRIDNIFSGKNVVNSSIEYRRKLETFKNSEATIETEIFTNGINATMIMKAEFKKAYSDGNIGWIEVDEIPKHLLPLTSNFKISESNVDVEFVEASDDTAMLRVKFSEKIQADGKVVIINHTYPLKYISIPELTDMRIDADGTEYECSGEALRSLQRRLNNKSIQVDGGDNGENDSWNSWLDWSEITNKPFSKEVITQDEVLVDRTTVEFKTSLGKIKGIGTGNVIVGGKYVVTWNGTEYTCFATKKNQSVHLGNLSLTTDGEDTGEPFVIEMISPTASLITKNSETVESVTIKIESVEYDVYQTLDPKYIPDMYYSEGELPEVISPTATYPVDTSDLAMIIFNENLNLQANETYVVNWNGTEYITPCKNFQNFLYLGNDISFLENDTGEPFIITSEDGENWVAICIYDTDDVTASIRTLGSEKISKINNKYLDLSWLPTKTERKLYSGVISAGENIAMFTDILYKDLTHGEAIIVYVDGERYEVNTVEGEDDYLAGNSTILTGAYSSGTPFILAFTKTYSMIKWKDTVQSDMSFELAKYDYNKMPSHYLPAVVNFDAVNDDTVSEMKGNVKNNVTTRYKESNVLFAKSSDTGNNFITYCDNGGFHLSTTKNLNLQTPLINTADLSKMKKGQHLVVKEDNLGLLILEPVDPWVIESASGKKFKINVDDSGALSTTQVK